MDRYDNNTTRFIKAAVTYCRENDWSDTDIVEALCGTFGVSVNQIADAGYQNIVQQYMNEINKGVDRYILEHAKKLITDFCLKEYNCEGDFSDLAHISIAYTYTSDEEIPIEIVVDLVHYEMKCYLSGKLFRTRTYDSLGDLAAAELEYLNFDELVSLTHWEEESE